VFWRLLGVNYGKGGYVLGKRMILGSRKFANSNYFTQTR
jgi:hypothetical protein